MANGGHAEDTHKWVVQCSGSVGDVLDDFRFGAFRNNAGTRIFVVLATLQYCVGIATRITRNGR